MAYSIEVREKALNLLADGHSDDQVSKDLSVSKFTLQNWKKLIYETGSLEKKKASRKPGKPYKYKPETLKKLLKKKK